MYSIIPECVFSLHLYNMSRFKKNKSETKLNLSEQKPQKQSQQQNKPARVAKHSTNDVRRGVIKVWVTNGFPFTVYVYLNCPFPRSSATWQTDVSGI